MSVFEERKFVRRLLTRFEAERKAGCQDHLFTGHEAAVLSAGLRLVLRGLYGELAPPLGVAITQADAGEIYAIKLGTEIADDCA